MKEESELQSEEPLDPATERVRVRLVKFGAVFMGLNILALMAVLAAIVYKIGGFGEHTDTETIIASGERNPVDQSFTLPSGSRLISAVMAEGKVSATLELSGGERELRVFALSDGTMVARFRFD